ncbi:MAG: hypothetical protein MJ025_06250, partial [Victivallaceae bacterium]|nr:hypothetical protein [Victivallaceae bacterium]
MSKVNPNAKLAIATVIDAKVEVPPKDIRKYTELASAVKTAAYGDGEAVMLYVNAAWTKDTCPEEFNGEKLTWGENAFASTKEIGVPAGENSYKVFLVDGVEAALGEIDLDGLLNDHNVIGYQSQASAGTVKNTEAKTGTKNSDRDLNIKSQAT